MNKTMAVVVLLAFGATSASAQQSSRGRSGGGHRSGGSQRSAGGHLSAARSLGGHLARAYSARPRVASGGSGSRYYGRGHAVPRGSVTGARPRVGGSRSSYRHPRAGYGTGYSRGRSYGYSSRYQSSYRNYRNYGYGRGYYGGSRYYGYSPYLWGGLGLSFYYSSGYPYVGGYSAPYDYGYVTDDVYAGGGDEPYGEAADRDDLRDQGRADDAELQLFVMPDDASVWIDGAFRGTARGLGRLALPPGRHQVEVVRPGFRTTEREVDVRPGASVSLRIELERP